MARPTKFTPICRQRILDGLRSGLTRTAAAGYAGIHVSALTKWCERYSSFSTECDVAEAEAEARFTGILVAAAKDGEWKAAESWLKRRRRAEWGDNIAVDLDDEIRKLLGELAATGEGEAPG